MYVFGWTRTTTHSPEPGLLRGGAFPVCAAKTYLHSLLTVIPAQQLPSLHTNFSRAQRFDAEGPGRWECAIEMPNSFRTFCGHAE